MPFHFIKAALIPQFLQRLNIMDYSLLVGIHDPSIPSSGGVNQDEEEADEDDEYMYVEDDEGQYVSSDELEAPHSPSSATGDSHTF